MPDTKHSPAEASDVPVSPGNDGDGGRKAILKAPQTAIRTLRGALTRDPTVEGLSPEAAGYARRNFRLGVLNGVMFTLVEALIAPSLVLALFVSRLGAPNVLIGLLPAVLAGGWFLPQLLVASRVSGMPRVMH